jgi:hypothetical protein
MVSGSIIQLLAAGILVIPLLFAPRMLRFVRR